MKKTTTHGGPRKGSGRPKGTARGRRVIGKTITLTVEAWKKIDAERGAISRGKFIEAKL
jgi:hypothetical protein